MTPAQPGSFFGTLNQMKLTPEIIAKYNTENTILMLSTYPREGHLIDPKALAVAPVTKNKINAIYKEAQKQGTPVKFVVIADAIEGKTFYEEDNHLVVRAWIRNELNVFAVAQRIAGHFPKAKTLVIEHEFGIFGLKNTITAQFPFFLLINRLLGRKVVLILHQVIFDLGELSGHLHLKRDSFYTKLYSYLIRVNYFMFGILANHLTVFDQALKIKLSKYVNAKKITALAHPNNGQPVPGTKNAIKKSLGLDPDTFYIMFCGYVTWYKGADWLVKTFKKIRRSIKSDQPVKLIIAGGKSSSLEIDPKYLNYYNKLEKACFSSKYLSITGVLSEEEYPEYIAAADLMIMPYRLMMSSSGPFSYAQKAGTPSIFSNKLEPMTHAEDFQIALQKTNIDPKDLIFALHPKSLLNRINQTIENKDLLKKMGQLMKELGYQRSDSVQASKYLAIFKNS